MVRKLSNLTELFFKDEITYDEEAQEILKEEQVPKYYKYWQISLFIWMILRRSIKEQIKATQKETKQRGKKLFMPIRVATTGQMHGPEFRKQLNY